MSSALEARPLPFPVEEEPHTLFGDLLAELPPELRPTPIGLLPYMRDAGRNEIRAEARMLFAWWLHRQQDGQVVRMGTEPTAKLPCAHPSVIDAFVPAWPDAEDYSEGEDDEEYIAAYSAAELERARAKRVCFEKCPLRTECLARSIKIDTAYLQPNALDEHAVLGGWGPGARIRIFNRFHELRSSYLNGRMGEGSEAEFEQAARALALRHGRHERDGAA